MKFMYKRCLRGCLVVFLLFTMAGCSNPNSHQAANSSGNSNFIIDTKGVNMKNYYQDTVECEAYAEQVTIVDKAAKTAAGGAVLGGVVGAIVGDSGTAGRGAGVGAITGAVKGTSSGYRERRQVIRSCLRGRGYKVLN